MIWAACANGLHRTGEWLEGLLTHGLGPVGEEEAHAVQIWASGDLAAGPWRLLT